MHCSPPATSLPPPRCWAPAQGLGLRREQTSDPEPLRWTRSQTCIAALRQRRGRAVGDKEVWVCQGTLELPVASTGKKATEAVLSDTPELGWTPVVCGELRGAGTCLAHGPGSRGSWGAGGLSPLSPLVSRGALKDLLLGGLLPPAKGLRAPAALPWADQGVSQQLVRQALNLPFL